MEKQERFTFCQLKIILNVLVWGTVSGSFLIWLFLPWNLPIYHKGALYYNGPKFPLLILLLLPFLSFIQEKSDLETMRLQEDNSSELQEISERVKRKGIKKQISAAIMESVVVFAFMFVILFISLF